MSKEWAKANPGKHAEYSRIFRRRQKDEREKLRQLADQLLNKDRDPRLVQLATADLPRFQRLREERLKEVEQDLINTAHEEALKTGVAHDWVREHLDKRLDSNQLSMSRWWGQVQHRHRISVVNASRQIGKSRWAVTLALSFAITTARAQVKYGATSKIQARGIIKPHLDVLLEGCPKELMPIWDDADSCYFFKHNGARLTIIACDAGKVESIAGQHAHLFLIDEGGAVDNLDFVVKDIALPMTLNTNGRIIIFSTPARSKGHSFKSYCDAAKEAGTYLERQIFDNPRISDEEIRDHCVAAGGATSTTWRREYLVEHVTDEETAVLPEATNEQLQLITLSDEVLSATRSPFVDRYVVVKPGWNPSSTGVLLGHFDYRLKRAVIEDEVVIKKMDSVLLNQQLGEHMGSTWGDGAKPYRCLGPIEDKLLVEMHSLGWRFASPQTDLTDVDINKLRHSITHVRGPKLYIHERCSVTKRQLENAVWDKRRKAFEPSKDDGRYELVTAAIFFRRELNERHDPTPRGLAAHPALGLTIPLGEPSRHAQLARSVGRLLRVGRWR